MLKNYNWFIGIDPGKQGFATLLTDNGVIGKYPLLGDPKINRYDSLINVLENLDPMKTIVGCEDLHAMYSVGAKQTFQLGKSCGKIEGILEAMNFPYALIAPKTWQKEMFKEVPQLYFKKSKTGRSTKDNKQMSILACQKYFPDADLRKSDRARVPNDNVCDSLLIAKYVRDVICKEI